jgi:hypothetical protein
MNEFYSKEFCDERQKGVEARFAAMDKAIALATISLERRLDLLNEFRGQSEDQAARFVSSEVLDAKLESIINRLNIAEQWKANMEGRMWAISIGVTVFNILLGIALTFIE